MIAQSGSEARADAGMLSFAVFGVVLGIENNLFDRLTCFTGQNARTAVLVVRPRALSLFLLFLLRAEQGRATEPAAGF